jgi:Skp family chaperone for outer membrane proteins
MEKTKTLRFGVMLAAAIAGIYAGSAFQAPVEKYGIVDISKVAEDSDNGKSNQVKFSQMKKTRESLLEFIDKNRVISDDQVVKLRNLWIKEAPSPQDQSELQKLMLDISTNSKHLADLVAKTSGRTPDENTVVDEFTRRSQRMDIAAKQLYDEFMKELQDWADQNKQKTLDKANLAIEKVAKDGGYLLVLDSDIAPYSANDLTAASIQTMNANK